MGGGVHIVIYTYRHIARLGARSESALSRKWKYSDWNVSKSGSPCTAALMGRSSKLPSQCESRIRLGRKPIRPLLCGYQPLWSRLYWHHVFFWTVWVFSRPAFMSILLIYVNFAFFLSPTTACIVFPVCLMYPLLLCSCINFYPVGN